MKKKKIVAIEIKDSLNDDREYSQFEKMIFSKPIRPEDHILLKTRGATGMTLVIRVPVRYPDEWQFARTMTGLVSS